MFIANASSMGPTAAPPRTAKAFGCMAAAEATDIIIAGAVAEYRGACVNEDAVDACLAAARCSIIDAEAVGPPDDCGDSIEGRVHRV